MERKNGKNIKNNKDVVMNLVYELNNCII